MIGIIITGHGKIASGILSSISLIYGETEKLSAIDFTEDISPELLEEKISLEIDRLNENGVLIFSDIVGGTPFKSASIISLKKENVKVIGGMNLPMILEVLSEREYLDVNKLKEFALETGKSEIVSFELSKREENIDEDGI